MNENLLFIAKRLADLSDEIDSLREDEKRYIIERAERISPDSLTELYNSLGEYAEL